MYGCMYICTHMHTLIYTLYILTSWFSEKIVVKCNLKIESQKAGDKMSGSQSLVEWLEWTQHTHTHIRCHRFGSIFVPDFSKARKKYF